MIITALDCFSMAATTRSSLFHKSLRFSKVFKLNPVSSNRAFQRIKATLITNSESFEVGNLIGSYGFMNITRYYSFLSLLIYVNPDLSVRVLGNMVK